MDPVTQTLLGATAAQAALGGRLGRAAALAGAIGGELPDVDVFFPWADPALPIEFHRHFTHALVMIPLGGALGALPLMLLPPLRRRWKLVLAAATVGCATHALLDNCTSYGTYLLWPFVDRRLAWDIISIIDPVFTLLLLAGLAWAVAAAVARPARVALGLAALYLGLGIVQHARAAAAQSRLAEDRGHVVDRGRVMPTLANLVVWRSVYESGGRLYADAIRAGAGRAAVREGGSEPVARLLDFPPHLAGDPRVREVFAGFAAFADGYVAALPAHWRVIGDMRYSLDTAGFEPFWGIRVSAGNPHPEVTWVHLAGDRPGALGDLWRDMLDRGRFPLQWPRADDPGHRRGAGGGGGRGG